MQHSHGARIWLSSPLLPIYALHPPSVIIMSTPHLTIVLHAAERLEKRRLGHHWALDGNTLQVADVVAAAL